MTALYDNYKVVGDIDINDIAISGDGAYPTSRVLSGSSDHGYAAEYVETGIYRGRKVNIIYLFDDGYDVDEDGEPYDDDGSYDWDSALNRIEYCD